MTDNDVPTVVVSYAHSNPGWVPEQVHERKQHVIRLVTALREFGIQADADVFHQNEDWTRWGPRKVQESDFVLIVASEAWRHGWMGSGDEQMHKGVRAEADVVRSIQSAGQAEFQRRCRIILLPGSDTTDIPPGMDGLLRHRLEDFDLAAMEPLLRDLTNQPVYTLPPVGRVPVLPPAMVARSTNTDSRGANAQLEEKLAALPEPRPGDGPHQAWYRLRLELEAVSKQLQDAPAFAPVYANRSDARRAVEPLLTENSTVHRLYRPLIDVFDDVRADQWHRHLRRTIIPNNSRLVEIINTNWHLLTNAERETVGEFIVHASELQARHEEDDWTPSSTPFPKAMSSVFSDEPVEEPS